MKKIAIVAGASSGIGQACVRNFRTSGWTVYGISRARPAWWDVETTYLELDLVNALDRGPEQLRGSLIAMGALADRDPYDVGLTEIAVVHAVGDIYDGVGGAGPEWNRWKKSMDLCVGTAVLLAQATFETVQQCAGSFTFISSVAASSPYPGIADYSAAKAALVVYTKSLAAELATSGARANSVSPAVVDTPLFRKGPYSAEEAARWHALARLGRPEEIASLVVHLAGQDGTWITGQDYVVDGGMALL